MRAVLAIVAILAAPVTATADEPAPVPAPTESGGAPGEIPATAPQQPEQPVEGPKADPAYGEHPERDTRDFPAPKGKDIVIVSYPDRSTANIATLAGLAAGGAIIGALGLYYNIDSRSAADDVSAHKYTGQVWSAD